MTLYLTQCVKILSFQQAHNKNITKRSFWRRQWHPTPVLLPGKSHGWRSLVGCSPWGRSSRTRLSNFTFPFHFHALEKEMAPHSSALAWRTPGMGKAGGLPSLGSHRVGHDWSDSAVVVVRGHFNFFFLLSKLSESVPALRSSSISVWTDRVSVALQPHVLRGHQVR